MNKHPYKLLIILFCSLPINFSSDVYGQNNKSLNLKLSNVTLEEVIRNIEQKSDYYFIYEDQVTNSDKKMSIDCSDCSLENIVKEISERYNLSYEIRDTQIILIAPPIEANPSQQPKEKTISGKVVDKNGMPLIGATVLITGTLKGTITNADGNFKLSVPVNTKTLTFSYVGMNKKELNITGLITVRCELENALVGLEEVVAIGYATMKKEDLTGSIGSVDSKILVSKHTVNPMEALQGSIAGVDISASSGRPGLGYSIQIRGQNSLSAGDPLYVVDGVPTDNIDFLNPQDIERIDILKDASSSAIYGSRATNGVVLVTTKNGNINKNETTVSYNANIGYKVPARIPDFMDGQEWWEFRQNAFVTNDLNKGILITDPDIGGLANSELLRTRVENNLSCDWGDYVLKNSIQQNHSLIITGNSKEKFNYVIGFGYQHEDGNIIENEWLKKYTLKLSVNHRINKKLAVGANLNISKINNELGSYKSISNSFAMSPLTAPYGEDPYGQDGELLFQPAKYAGITFSMWVNPLWEIKDTRNNRKVFNGLGNVFIQYSYSDWLELKSNFSPLMRTIDQGHYYGSHTQERLLADPSADLTTADKFSYTFNNSIVIKKSYDNHSFNLLVMNSLYDYSEESSSIYVENLPFESLWYNLNSAENIISVGSSYSKETLLSFITRLHYAYQKKYLLTLSERWDGSSKLSKGNKWSEFPSGAFAWRISEEDFLERLNFISNLKWRIGFGFTGNNNIEAYSTFLLANNQTDYDFNGERAIGFAPGGIVNSSLKWERTREWNMGLDFGFFKNRISGAIDVYDKLSKDLLLNRELPLEVGWSNLIDNIGSVSNKGIEVLIRTINVLKGPFFWETSITFSRNKNAIVELFNEKEDLAGNAWFIGKPVNVNYTYVFDGIWQEDEISEAILYGQSPGQAKVKDFNPEDGAKIDENDKRIIGSPMPDWIGSFATTIRIKTFEISANIYTKQGVQVYSDFHKYFTNLAEYGRQKLNVNYYMPINSVTEKRESNEYPQPNNVGAYWDVVGYYKDASFIRVKNISIGYVFPQKYLQHIGLSYLKLYTNVLNPFVITDYDGYDPEWARAGFGSNSNGFITYQIGLSTTF